MTKLNRIAILTHLYPFQQREWAAGLFRHANHAFKLAEIAGKDI